MEEETDDSFWTLFWSQVKHANLMAVLKREMFILKVNRRDEPGGVSVTSDQLYSPNVYDFR